MATVTCGAAVLAAASVLACCLSACGVREGGGAGGSGLTVGVLLPDNLTSRWEAFDKPLIERSVRDQCGECTVDTLNAQNDLATQRQQMDSMITRGVRVLILDALDDRAMRSSVQKAHAAGVDVVAYDRLTEGPIAGYVSFDNEQVGRLQAEGLLRAMGESADEGQIVVVNGPVTDPNSAELKKGALSALRGRVEIGAAYDTVGWSPLNAFNDMNAAIANLGADEVDGVLTANDGMASGVIAALRAARLDPLPPVTGQDAELAAVQRLLEGDQHMTVYKPFRAEAEAAARMAVALSRGESIDDLANDVVRNNTSDDIPAVLLQPVPVTAGDIRDTLVRDGFYTIDQICTEKHEAACERVGLR